MPVKLVANLDSADAMLQLRGVGALTLQIPATSRRVDALAPWLSIRSVHDVAWSSAGVDHPVALPLQPLDMDERLIGYAGADPDALAEEFAGKKLVRVPLDSGDFLPGDISAWEALDGLVLDESFAGKLTEGQVRALLAGGTAIAIRRTHPRDAWPWHRQGEYWIARIDIAGPTSAYVPSAYAPTETWLHGWPAAVRRLALLAAAVFALVLTTATLLRWRGMTIIAIVVCGIATALAFVWRARQSPIIATGGTIAVVSKSTTQRDAWTYHAALREADDSFALGANVRPVFGYRQQADELHCVQQCAADGRPLEMRFHLAPGPTLALQARSLQAGDVEAQGSAAGTSPLRAMADKLYARDDDQIFGAAENPPPDQWPAVIVWQKTAGR